MRIVIAFVPVLLFAAGLQLMDSFKLVNRRAILTAIAVGAAAAIACAGLHDWLQSSSGVRDVAFRRYVAPITEEVVKAAFVALLIARRRVAFLVDAAVQGFAVGAGFALVENLTYLIGVGESPLLLWAVRGLGTAMLHGGATAIFAILTRTFADRYPDQIWRAAYPGLLAAIGIHSAFNHAPLPPVAMTLILLIALPMLVVVVFQRSEAATRDWVVAGLDLDIELLQLVGLEAFSDTRMGQYLRRLRDQFGPSVALDMFCLLRLQLELSVQAKALLMAREAGLDVPADEDLPLALAELEYLRRAIGPTGLLALKPLQVTSHRDDWHRFLLTHGR
jgi:protease PrsW